IQGKTSRTVAIKTATRVNDYLARRIVKLHPTRFAGFASLPLQDPDAAADELKRTVQNLGFKGALVNGFSNFGNQNVARYYDDPIYFPFWECVQDVDVPIYLHPRTSLTSHHKIFGESKAHSSLIRSAWGWGFETATHALRLIVSGLFDRYPR